MTFLLSAHCLEQRPTKRHDDQHYQGLDYCDTKTHAKNSARIEVAYEYQTINTRDIDKDPDQPQWEVRRGHWLSRNSSGQTCSGQHANLVPKKSMVDESGPGWHQR